ncbi:hypothetical protein F4811DRAFT_551741 [Daldinia bambusicola]|nr:hypothetical protein F4811DRAFT_551741 [Daldinia bambusicola]
MADPLLTIPEVIKQTSKVAKFLVEYGIQVKDAPVLIGNITLEVNTLKAILETLHLTLGYNAQATPKAGLSDSLGQCKKLLDEILLLVAPEPESESDEERPPQKTRNTRGPFCKFGRGRPTSAPSREPNGGSNAGQLQSIPQTHQVTSEYYLTQYERHTNVQQNAPRTPTGSTRRHSVMGLAARFKWPLFQKSKAEDLLKRLERHKTQLSLAMQVDNTMNLTSMVTSIKDIEANLNDQEKRSVLAWLSPKLDMYEFHREQHDKQEDETCEWITSSRGWKQWLNGGSYEPGGYRRFIWIYGIPGAGKTVLASFLIDSIAVHCRATGYSYYYCHNERNQDETLHFLRWIVGDLSRQIDRFIPKELERLNQSQAFDIDALLNCFAAISRKFKSEDRRVYLVIDAVDESKKPRRRLLDVLVRIGTEMIYENVSILMTSREEDDIVGAMRQATVATNPLPADKARNSEGSANAFTPYTSITMSNGDVMRAIQKYVEKQFERNARFKMWPLDFRAQIETKLARNARGMFRWVACQIDILERIYMDAEKVLKALDDLPETLFDTYDRILQSIESEQREFARTALALICSSTFQARSADVLVQASLHNVRHGALHLYTLDTLREILGCLIKVTNLRRRPQWKFRREDDNAPLQRVSVAHFTVKEFLFAKPKKAGEPRPAGEFAVSESSIRELEMQVVFNGLLQWGRNRPANSRHPTRYEEHCLETSESAMRGARQGMILRNQSIWDSVVPCLIPGRPHLRVLTNMNLRRQFPRWARLSSLDEVVPGTNRPLRQETGILASLILLNWPEFTQKYLKEPGFQTLAPEAKHSVWTTKFSINAPENLPIDIPRAFEKGKGITLLQLCVAWKRPEFLELFINAGANFTHEPNIVFTALANPWGIDESEGDGTATGQLLKMLLEAGADPNPPGYVYTPLQAAVWHLEESWVQSLLIEARDANSIGDPKGKHPYGLKEPEQWASWHPLKICHRAPAGSDPDNDVLESVNNKSRKQIEQLLIQYGARMESDVIDVSSDDTVEDAPPA